MNNELNGIEQFVETVYGLDISKYDHSFLRRALEKRLTITQKSTISDYIHYLSINADEAVRLFQSLNNTYTEFFRNPLTFAQLEQWILPQLMEENTANEELRIWSAGCSSGQEAYSVAMLIENINSNKQKKVRYRIIATDISESVLLEAKKGEYSENDIQRIRVQDLKRYFVKSGKLYTISDSLKRHVNFSNYNLLDNLSFFPQESIYGDFNLVVCSNMLFYYKLNHQKSIVKKLINSLDKHGYLITGDAEKHIVEKFSELFIVAPPSPIFKRRSCLK